MNFDFKNEIKKQGLKQNFIANKLGITKTNFSNKLSGRARFTADELIKLVNFLRLNPKKIFKEA